MNKYKGIWPVAARDLVMLVIQEIAEDKIFIASKSCNFPYPEQKGIVRAQLFIGGYVLEKINEQKTKVTYISDTDIKGSIPTMIKNKVMERQGSVPASIET